MIRSRTLTVFALPPVCFDVSAFISSVLTQVVDGFGGRPILANTGKMKLPPVFDYSCLLDLSFLQKKFCGSIK